MKVSKIILTVMLLLIASFLFADNNDQAITEDENDWVPTIKHGLTGGTNYLFTEDGKLGHAFGQHFDYRISERGYLSFNIGYTELYKQIQTGDSPAFYRHLDLQSNIFYFGLNYQYFLTSGEDFMNPYLNVGLAPFAFDQDNGLTQFFNDGLLKAGLGVEFFLNEKFALTAEGNFNITTGEDFDLEPGYDMFADLSVGFSYRIQFPKPVCPCPPPEIPEELIQKISELESQINSMAYVPEPEPEPEPLDSSLYMIQPQDYLLDLCDKFYGDSTRWKDVYRWNGILSKTNPNLIYPFEEIWFKELQPGTIDPLDYEYYMYEVQPFETLWSIAKKEYDNPLAWIIIVRDNRDVLGDETHLFKPGIQLRLRTKVFNHE